MIQIWNRAIASGYLEHFELLWKGARRYKAQAPWAINTRGGTLSERAAC